VLGTGIDVCYAKENKRLFEKALEEDAIIGELPIPRRRISRYGSASLPECRSESSSKANSAVTQEVSFAPNLLNKPSAKLVQRD
jgi:hypothetical protein